MSSLKSDKPKKRSFKEKIRNFIWTEGTYSERPSSNTLSRKEIKETLEVQRSIKITAR